MKTKIIIAALVCLSFPCFAQFSDVPKAGTISSAVRKLLENKIISVPSDRKFNGEGLVDRYQLALILDKVLERSGKMKEIEARPLEKIFIDVPSNHFAFKPVQDLTKLGVFTVPDHKRFVGDAKLSRYNFYSFFAVFLESVEQMRLPAAPGASGYYDVPSGSPYYVYIQKLVGAGLLEGRGALNGEEPIRRSEMAIFVSKILDYYSPAQAKEEAKAAPGTLISRKTTMPSRR